MSDYIHCVCQASTRQQRCCLHIFFKLEAKSNDSSRCIIDGTKENEYIVLMDMGDMMIEHSSGGNSAEALVDSEWEKNGNIHSAAHEETNDTNNRC